MADLILVCFSIIPVLIVVVFVRNNYVLKYRLELIDLIDLAAVHDAKQGKRWQWRYDVLESVPYDQMVIYFWKPLKSFYPDKSFINPEATKQ